MSNIARLNKNSIISLSTNDNTSSLKVNKRMDEADLKRIQRRLADKVSTNNKRKPIKKYKDKTKVRNWLNKNIPKKTKALGDSTDLKSKAVKSYNRILSPQLNSLRSQFNSILDRTRKRKSSGGSKKAKVSGLLSTRHNLSKKNSVKTKSAKSDNKSIPKKEKKKSYKKYDGFQRMKIKSKTSKSSKLERKKSLNGKLMTPSIKHINSEAKLELNNQQSYGLFYSPRDFSSKILNISTSYKNNFIKTKKINMTSNLNKNNTNSKSKYLKRMGKKNPLFELRKGLLSNQKYEKNSREKSRSRELSKKGSTNGILSKKNSAQYMKKPMFFEKKAADIDNLLQLISSRESINDNLNSSYSNLVDINEKEMKGNVNPLLVKMTEDLKKNFKEVILLYESEMERLTEKKEKSRFVT